VAAPISEVIVRIDQALDEEAPDTPVDVDAIIIQARRLVAPDQTEKPYAQRYLTALQEVPDVVVAHGKVTAILKRIPQENATLVLVFRRPTRGRPHWLAVRTDFVWPSRR
jgi:hypothetical protein